MNEEYMKIPVELRVVLFDLERSFGLPVGGGDVFSNRSVREQVDVRYAFIYIANNHYGFSQSAVAGWIGVKQGLIFHAKRSVLDNIKHNIMYRNRIFNVAVSNGIMQLIYEITDIVENGRKRKICRNMGE